MIPLSVLDLSPIVAGSQARDSLLNSLDLARHVERWGYRRYWLAEHHGMPGIASAATSVVMGYVAAGTSTIRIGAGGIMLPNHSPLVIAEQFGTLESLYPDRVDLALGRATGTDPVTARALRRNLTTSVEQFPDDVRELLAYFQAPKPGQGIQAVPGVGLSVPVWILGSSLFGAQLAAQLGLPYAFASHFAPAQLLEALALYRERFQPSEYLARPYFMPAISVFAADTTEQARLLASSWQQAFVNLYAGRPSKLPPPVPDYLAGLSPLEQHMLKDVLQYTAVGTADEVGAQIRKFIELTSADELIIACQCYDHQARLRCYEIVSGLL